MPGVVVGTHYVIKDEPCMGLYEINEQSLGNKGFHRYQIVHVVRNDRPAEYRKDLGPVSQFKGIDQLRIPGGVVDGNKFQILHTVGELMNIADDLRGDCPFDKAELAGVHRIKD